MKKHIKLYEEYKEIKFKTKEELEDFLDGFGLNYNYTINDDLTVDVDDDVSINSLSKYNYVLPFQFGKVSGTFNIHGMSINSLKGCPSSVGYTFFCSHNELTTLEGGPENVGSDFYCNNNQLKSLEYCPTYVGGNFGCHDNELTSLVFAPKKPYKYGGNPCSPIYDRLGFTIEAHVEALLTYEHNPVDTLRRLRPVYPERYFDILSASKKLREMVGNNELVKAYDISKGVEGDFY